MEEQFDLYVRGIKNRASVVRNKRSRIKRYILVLYEFLMLFFAKRIRKGDNCSYYYINGKNESKWKILEQTEYQIYRGLPQSFSKLFKTYTFASAYGFFKRLHIWFNGMIIYIQNKEESWSFDSWIEFYYMWKFFENIKATKIITRGHYDEETTWLSGLCKINNIEFVIYQHGVVDCSTKIPNKLYVTKFYGFDNYSINTFKNNYIENDAEFIIRPFETNAHFEEYEFGEKIIAIAEQMNPDWVNSIVSKIQNLGLDYKIIIMLHPLSSYNYNELDCIVERTKKIKNPCCVITNSSTLALDYYSVNKDIKVFFSAKEMQNTFEDYPFQYFSDFKDIKNYLVLGDAR